MLNPSFAYRSALELNATFSADFAGQIADFPIGSWQGPVQSGFGFHVFLNDHQITPLEAIGQQVNEDYRRARQLEARRISISKTCCSNT